MPRYMRIMCLGLLFGALALTAPVTCGPGSLQSYIDLAPDGCTIDGQVVLGFVRMDPLAGATEIPPESILISPLDTPNAGLRFDVNAGALQGELFQSRFVFTLMANPTVLPLGRVTGMISGSTVGADGAVTAVNDLCLGGTFVAGACTATPDNLVLFDIGSDALLADSRSFAPIQTLGALIDLAVDGGTSGSASLSSFTIRFQAVPEPATVIPVSVGLLALTLRRQRR